ncbi:MAG: RpiB/LacA/LacB family sugar-phosphate isomerase [Christensenellaceae bacterium]|jgi:ribose 5-phosphate isomerase B
MKIVVGGDHAGYPLKEKVLEKLARDGHTVQHVGSFTPEMVDFPDIAEQVCAAILSGAAERGIMVCGTGVGAAIACNKVPGVRASVVHDIYTAHQCVEHDNVQVMALGAQIVGETVAAELIDLFLAAQFSESEEFHIRVEKLARMEEKFRNG